MFNNIIEPSGNSMTPVQPETDSPLENGLNGLDFVSNGPLDDVGQLWLWTDDGNDDWLSSFS